jgi:hypothetical protein
MTDFLRLVNVINSDLLPLPCKHPLLMNRSFFVLLLLSVFRLQAQDIPVKQEDRSTYSFVVPEYIVITDFEIVSAIEQKEPGNYLVQVRALNARRETDTGIRGNIVFEINGHHKPVLFSDGIGQVVVNLKDQEELVMKDLDSEIIRKGKINKPQRWYGLLMLIPALVILYLIISRIMRKRRLRKDGL